MRFGATGSGVDRSMQLFRRLLAASIVAGIAPLALAPPAHALGTPSSWEIGMQPSAGPIKTQIIDLHDLVMVIITLITVFVGVLLLWVVFRYNSRKNPTPSKTSHNSVLEIAWTVLPVLILVIIAIPSFRLVYYQDRTHDPDMTIKVTGHQWYWEYTYPDHGNLDFTSYIVPDDQLKPGQLRLLTVDNQLVVPVGKNIRVLTTSADVIHSFFVPALGVQRYAIPGPDHRDLVQGRQDRGVLRRMQPDLRPEPQPDADRRARGDGSGVRRVAGAGQGQVRGHGAGAA